MHRSQKYSCENLFKNPNDSESNEELTKLINLWRTVIAQAIIDASSSSKRRRIKMFKIKAIRWFQISSQDFQDVCSYANTDSWYTKKKASIWISNLPK